MEAIETTYAGCRFRSRLEARWAVFFDNLGIKWQYEPEGFETPRGGYLPDFKIRLWDRDVWFEIKPDIYGQRQFDDRWNELAKEEEFYVTFGFPKRIAISEDGFPCSDQEGFHRIYEHGELCSRFFFCICPYCSLVDININGTLLKHVPSMKFKCCNKEWEYPKPMYTPYYGKIALSYDKARQARFEHGENG